MKTQKKAGNIGKVAYLRPLRHKIMGDAINPVMFRQAELCDNFRLWGVFVSHAAWISCFKRVHICVGFAFEHPH